MSEDVPARGPREATAGPDLRTAITELRDELLGRAVWLLRGRRDAEDLVHDTVIRALTFEDGYEERGQVRAWLHRILYSVFIEYTRSAGRRGRRNAELSRLTAWRDSPLTVMGGLSPGVARELAALPKNFRAPVILVDLGDRTYLEAAAELAIPKGTVMSRLHRGRRMLGARLRDDGAPPEAGGP